MLAVRVYLRAIKQVFRSPTRMSIVLAFPLGFTFVFAFIFGGGEFLNAESVYSIGVINDDTGSSDGFLNEWRSDFLNYTRPWSDNSSIDPMIHGFGHLFIESLQGKTSMRITDVNYRITMLNTASQAIDSVKSRAIQLTVRITPDFSYGILSGINSRELLLNRTRIVDHPLIRNTNITINLLGDPSYTVFQDVRTEIEKSLTIFKSLFYDIEIPAGHLNIVMQNLSSYEYTGYDYFIAGFFTFGIILASGAIAGILGEERAQGTLDRLKISNMKSFEYLGGITLNQITVGALQLLIMFISAYLFGFNGTGDPLSAYIVALITILPVLGLGFFISAFIPDGRDAMGVISILSAPIGFLSGAFLPIPEVPLIENLVPTGTGSFRALQLWDFFPFYHSVSAIRKILLFNHTLSQVYWDLVFLLIGGVVFFGIGLIFFVWRVFSPEK